MRKLLLLPAILFIISCSKDEENPPTNPYSHYINLEIDGAEHLLSYNDLILNRGLDKYGCIDGYTFGMRPTVVTDVKTKNGFIASLSFGITKKMEPKIIGAPDEFLPGFVASFKAEEEYYMQSIFMRGDSQFRTEISFPTKSTGFEPASYDVALAEAYLSLTTKSGKEYSSAVEDHVKPQNENYFEILRIGSLGEGVPEADQYNYYVEGEFKVTLYNKASATDSIVVEGQLQLPLYTFKTSEALSLCQ